MSGREALKEHGKPRDGLLFPLVLPVFFFDSDLFGDLLLLRLHPGVAAVDAVDLRLVRVHHADGGQVHSLQLRRFGLVRHDQPLGDERGVLAGHILGRVLGIPAVEPKALAVIGIGRQQLLDMPSLHADDIVRLAAGDDEGHSVFVRLPPRPGLHVRVGHGRGHCRPVLQRPAGKVIVLPRGHELVPGDGLAIVIAKLNRGTARPAAAVQVQNQVVRVLLPDGVDDHIDNALALFFSVSGDIQALLRLAAGVFAPAQEGIALARRVGEQVHLRARRVEDAGAAAVGGHAKAHCPHTLGDDRGIGVNGGAAFHVPEIKGAACLTSCSVLGGQPYDVFGVGIAGIRNVSIRDKPQSCTVEEG